MAQDIATVQDPARLLPAIDPRNPAAALSWPDWLVQRVTLASGWGEGIVIDGKRRPTIPTSLTLTGPMRKAIEGRLAALQGIEQAGPAEETFAELGAMIQFYAFGRTSEDATSGKAKIYFGTLSDMPAWCVKEAIARWFRGATGDKPDDYKFAPSPGRLRQITEFVLNVAKGQVHPLQRLLDAVSYDGLDEKQREAAQKRFAGILAGVAAPPTPSPAEDRAAEARRRAEILEADRAERASRQPKEDAA